MTKLPVEKGMLHYLIGKVRPDLAQRISETHQVETIVIGLGSQGTKHAGIMHKFGTTVAAGIAPGRDGSRIHEVIPVYDNVRQCLEERPDIAAASIWRHYSAAREAAIEVIEAGIPFVVLITEGIPLRDVRDILVAVRKRNTILLGGNTPGVIFPPEGIKIGMLPDVFYPQETSPGVFGPEGVTIVSRSGAILYHMSDALASAGIAQNAVLGIGGDGAIGCSFRELVPLVMGYDHTDLVVVAGEIGGSQEELLARDIRGSPSKYPKPIVAIISGANAPQGKTMGHAGAIIAPGQPYGTFQSKKEALEAAGVPVVNSQYDLIEVVRSKLKGKTYFQIGRYYSKMKETWEERPEKPSWGTLITRVQPNLLMVSGYPLQELIESSTLLETAHLLVEGDLPDENTLELHKKRAIEASKLQVPSMGRAKEDISKTLCKCLLLDQQLAEYPARGKDGPVNKTIFCLGRVISYLGSILGTELALIGASEEDPFSHTIYRAITGSGEVRESQARMLEGMIVASVDHGVTPPSAQATIIAASTRASYEVAVAQGVGAITDVHGGAGAKAATFLTECISRAERGGIDLEEATRALMTDYVKRGKPIEGMGHRIHTEDPRRDVLWRLAEYCGVAGRCVEISKLATKVFEEVRGINLPINVDGVIGAIVADMGLNPSVAKALFIYGRIAGLSAHYFEEISSQPEMRRINFSEAVYKGKELRRFP